MKSGHKGWIFSGLALTAFGGVLIATGFGFIPGIISLGLGLAMTGVGTVAAVLDKHAQSKINPNQNIISKVIIPKEKESDLLISKEYKTILGNQKTQVTSPNPAHDNKRSTTWPSKNKKQPGLLDQAVNTQTQSATVGVIDSLLKVVLR